MKIRKQTDKEIVIEMNNGEIIRVEQCTENFSAVDISGKYDENKKVLSAIHTSIHGGDIFTTNLHTNGIAGNLSKKSEKIITSDCNFKTTGLYHKDSLPLVSVFTKNK